MASRLSTSKSYLCALVLCTNFISINNLKAVRLGQGKAFVPQHLGEIAVIHDHDDFCVENENGFQKIQRCFMDKELRGISEKKLGKFLESGYVSVNRMSDGEYSLKAHGRLKGGGPILGKVLGWGIRGLGYGSAAMIGAFVATEGVKEIRNTLEDEDATAKEVAAKSAALGVVIGKGISNAPSFIQYVEVLASCAEKVGDLAPTL